MHCRTVLCRGTSAGLSGARCFLLQDTGRKKLILAGVVTDVCVAFPAVSALAEGFEVYVVVDASGTFNHAVRDAALNRVQQAGGILTSKCQLS